MQQIKLVKPYISFEEVETDFKGVFESGMFTKGQHVAALAKEISQYTGAKYTHLVTSATTALWTCLKLINIQKGDEVIVSDFSFPASVNVIEDLGAIPIFADVSLGTYNMLASELESKITAKTKAVMFVSALGNPSGINEIAVICKKYNILLIEDAACAIGSSENGIKCGNIADLTCFSFHPRKIVNTGEGGAITTNNEVYSKRLQFMLNHGAVNMKGLALDFEQFGYNFRLSELQAVMGRKQITKLDTIVKQRNEIRNQYIQLLIPIGFKPQLFTKGVKSNVQSVVFTVPQSVNRDELTLKLRELGIETTIGTYCLSECTYYKNRYNNVQPNASFLQENTITLPCFEGLDVNYIVESINKSI